MHVIRDLSDTIQDSPEEQRKADGDRASGKIELPDEDQNCLCKSGQEAPLSCIHGQGVTVVTAPSETKCCQDCAVAIVGSQLAVRASPA